MGNIIVQKRVVADKIESCSLSVCYFQKFIQFLIERSGQRCIDGREKETESVKIEEK